MNKQELNSLMEISSQTESFLLEYANGKYGKVGKTIDITEKVVETFMELSSKEEMFEVLSYLEFKDEMLEDKGGAGDLEDFVKYVLDKNENGWI